MSNTTTVHTFYHTTLSENKDKILKNGLITAIGERSLEIGEDIEAIYLFNNIVDLDNGLANWLGEWYEDYADENDIDFDDLELATFKVELPVNFPGLNFQNSPEHYESICYSNIPNEFITYLRED